MMYETERPLDWVYLALSSHSVLEVLTQSAMDKRLKNQTIMKIGIFRKWFTYTELVRQQPKWGNEILCDFIFLLAFTDIFRKRRKVFQVCMPFQCLDTGQRTQSAVVFWTIFIYIFNWIIVVKLPVDIFILVEHQLIVHATGRFLFSAFIDGVSSREWIFIKIFEHKRKYKIEKSLNTLHFTSHHSNERHSTTSLVFYTYKCDSAPEG